MINPSQYLLFLPVILTICGVYGSASPSLPGSGIGYVNTGGSGTVCDSAAPCATIKDALDNVEQIHTVYVTGESYSVQEDVVLHKTDVVVTKDLREGTPLERCTVTISTTAQFLITSSAISFSNLPFTSPEERSGMIQNTATPRADEFFAVKSGKLILDGCTVRSVELSADKSLITIEPEASLLLEDTLFNGITKARGNGPVLDVTLAKEDTLSIIRCRFFKCAALAEDVKAGAFAITTGTFSPRIEDCYFVGNTIGTASPTEQDVLVSNSSRFDMPPFANCYSSSDTSVVLLDGSYNNWVLPLTHVSSSIGEQIDGSYDYPTSTFEYAILSRPQCLAIKGSAKVEEMNTFTADISIVPSLETERAPVIVGSFGSSLHVYQSGNVHVNKIDFTPKDSSTRTDAVWGVSQGTLKLVECTFTRTSSDGSGGALFAEEKAALIVKGCSFFRCHASTGGAILCRSSASFVLTNGNKFDTCWTSGSGGAVSAAEVGVCFFIHDAELTRCSAGWNQGGGLYLSDCPASSLNFLCAADTFIDNLPLGILSDLKISNCSVTGIDQGDGGGVCLEHLWKLFSASTCEIIDCNATSGGGIYLSVSDDFVDSRTVFRYFYFNNNFAKSFGHDIYFLSSYGGPFTNETGPFDKRTCSTGTPYIEGRGTNYALLAMYVNYQYVHRTVDENWLLKGDQSPSPLALYVHCESTKSESCGEGKEASSACNSIYSAAKQLTVTNGNAIVVLEGIHSNDNMQITLDNPDGPWRIQGESESTTVSSIELSEIQGNSWVYLLTRLDLLNLHFALVEKSGKQFSSHLFNILGTLILTKIDIVSQGTIMCPRSILSLTGPSSVLSVFSCQFSSLSKAGNGGVITNDEASVRLSQELHLSNSTFDQCTAKGGDGGAIYYALDAGTTFQIGCGSEHEKTIFKSCHAEKATDGGKGGAVCLKVEPGFLPTSTSSPYAYINPLLHHIQFGNEDGTSEKNTASFGPDIFVYGLFLTLVSSSNFPVLEQWVTGDSSNHEFLDGWDTQAVGYEQGTTGPPVPLLSFQYSLFNTIYVHHQDGIDGDDCGTRDLPCRSIKQAFAMLTQETHTINILSLDESEASASLGTYPLTVFGSASLTVPSNADYTISAKASLMHWTFSVPETLAGSSLFSSSTSLLLLTSCSFSLPDKLSYSLFSFSASGLLVLSSVTINSGSSDTPSTPTYPLIVLDGASKQLSSFFVSPLLRPNEEPTTPSVTLIQSTVAKTGRRGFSGTYISATNAQVTINDNSVIDGTPGPTSSSSSSSSSSSLSNQEESSEPGVCTWSGSLISLSGGTLSLSSSTLASATDGAIALANGATANLVEVNFTGNGISDFHHARKNVRCSGEGSVVKVVSLEEYDYTVAGRALWMLAEEGCRVENGDGDTITLPFFTPIIEEVIGPTYAAYPYYSATTFTVSGINLLPCSLSFALQAVADPPSDPVPCEPLSITTVEGWQTVVAFSNSSLYPLSSYHKFILIAYVGATESSRKEFSADLPTPPDDPGNGEGPGGREEDDGGLSGGAVAGIVIAVVVVVALVIVIIVLLALWKLRKCCFGNKDETPQEQEMKEEEGNVPELKEEPLIEDPMDY